MTQIIDHDPAPAPAPAATRRRIPWGRCLLAVLVLSSPMFLIVGVMAAHSAGKSDAAACRKIVTSTGSYDDQYLDAIHAAKTGSDVQNALYGVYGAKGGVGDAAWVRLSSACSAAGVDIG